MRKVILFIASSLDGFIAGKLGEIDWLFSDQDYGYTEFFGRVDTVIMGRKTYELTLGFPDYPFQGTTGYVLSHSRAGDKHEHVEFIAREAGQLISELHAQPGKNIWIVGGSDVVRACVEQDLIDEYIVSIHPMILGDGIPLFRPPLPARQLIFCDCQSFDTGLVQITYSRGDRNTG